MRFLNKLILIIGVLMLLGCDNQTISEIEGQECFNGRLKMEVDIPFCDWVRKCVDDCEIVFQGEFKKTKDKNTCWCEIKEEVRDIW